VTSRLEREGVLETLTILDLSEGIAGPYAAQLFAQYGARVIKVERPGGGDPARSMNEASFRAANAGKLSLSLDYETPEGALVLRRLAEDADGIIEDHPTRRREDLGLDAAALIARVPRLVIGQVSGFGASGPYSDRPWTGLTLAAASGRLRADSMADEGLEAERLLGLQAFVGMLAGLWHAAQHEHGQVVDIGGMQALASLSGDDLAAALTGESSSATVQAPRSDPDLAALRRDGLLQEVEQPGGGTTVYPAGPFVFGAAAEEPARAPFFGEHTDYVLQDLVGLEVTEIESIRSRGIV